MDCFLECGDADAWKKALTSYDTRLESLQKPELVTLDAFYRGELPALLHRRDPDPFITKAELLRLMQWKLARGKWRPRLIAFLKSLDESQVESSSRRAFRALPDLSKAVSELTVLKGVGPATASAVLAAYAPEVAPFMSDEAMVAALGSAKDYTLKQYLALAERLQHKAKELSNEEEMWTPSEVERALWSLAREKSDSSKMKLALDLQEDGSESGLKKSRKRKGRN